MVPKPFPFPLQVGIDVCQISRLAKVQRSVSNRNKWARKVFTRLEWPSLVGAYQAAQKSMAARVGTDVGINGWNLDQKYFWRLPRFLQDLHPTQLDRKFEALDKEPAFQKLLEYLAGRWAAKEAVIKAHRQRSLYMCDISIVNPSKTPHLHPVEFGKENRLLALIDPPVDTIMMDEHVARKRGLRGFSKDNQLLQTETPLSRGEYDFKVKSSSGLEQGSSSVTRTSEGKTYFTRRAKIDESQRQIAQISISHDGDSAVAVCMASDEPGPTREFKSVVDDGSNPPLHEPDWGDDGFFYVGGQIKHLGSFGAQKTEEIS